MISFLLPLIVILLSNATTVYIFKKSFGKTLIFTLLLFSFPLFISGLIFNSFKIGYILNILYSISIIPFLIKNRKNTSLIMNFKSNYFSMGFFAFLAIYLFVFIYDFNRSFTMWDEKSHWGVMLKEMLRLDNFYSIDESTLMVHKDYPPILQLFELFWIKLSGTYKEAYAIRALHTLELSFFVLFIDKKEVINIKNIFKTIYKIGMIVLIGLLIILMFDKHGVINSIYNDYFLSLLVAYALLYIFFENDNSNFSIINISLILSFILLTKQVGLAFYMMIVFFYIITIIKQKKKIKEYIKLFIILFVIPFVLYKMWGIYISNFIIEKQFVISDIKLQELKDIIFNISNEKHSIYTNYISSIIHTNISWFKFFNISYLIGFIIFVILLFIVNIFNRIDWKKIIKLFITILLGACGYFVLMLLLYLFCFKEEGFTLASFDRYMDTYLIIEFIVLFIMVIKSIEKNKRLYLYLIISFILLLSINRGRIHYLKPTITRESITPYEVVSNRIIEKTNEKNKIFLLSQETESLYQFSVKYYANPRITNLRYYELPLDEMDFEDYFYNNVNDYMLKFDYLYVVNTTDELNNKYDFIFKNIKNDELYKIKNENGKVKLDLVE